MGFDNMGGRFTFETPFLERDGRVKVEWPGAGNHPLFAELNAEIRRHAEALGGSFIENPLYGLLGLKRLITAHPLGGCPMGEDHLSGAVDQFGRVFAADGSIHEGLFVIDGAVMPSALGVNPFLTISAFAERAADYKIREMSGTPYP